MFSIGNKFGGARRTAKPVEHSQPESTGNLVGARLTLGRASHAYDTKNAELTEARSTLAHLDQTIGEKGADGIDATADIHERQSLQSLVQQLELAVAALLQRKESAERAVLDATRAQAEDAIAAACMSLLALAPEWEQVFVTVSQLAIQTAHKTEGLRVAGGNEKYAYSVSEVKRQIQLFMGIAMCEVNGSGHIPSRLMRYETLTACFASICGAGKHDEHH